MPTGYIYLMSSDIFETMKLYKISATVDLADKLERFRRTANPHLRIITYWTCQDVDGCKKRIEDDFGDDRFGSQGYYMIHDMDDCERKINNIHLDDFNKELQSFGHPKLKSFESEELARHGWKMAVD